MICGKAYAYRRQMSEKHRSMQILKRFPSYSTNLAIRSDHEVARGSETKKNGWKTKETKGKLKKDLRSPN